MYKIGIYYDFLNKAVKLCNYNSSTTPDFASLKSGASKKAHEDFELFLSFHFLLKRRDYCKALVTHIWPYSIYLCQDIKEL